MDKNWGFIKQGGKILALFLFCLSQSAQADNSGVYLGAGLASAGISSSCVNGSYLISCNNSSNGSKDSTHLRLIAGYDFSKHFGIEAGWSELGTYRVLNATGLTVGEFNVSAVTLAFKGGNTFSSGFSIFGKIGLASVQTKYTTQPSWTLAGSANQKSSGFLGGVIGQYNINDTVGFRVSMEMIDYTDAEFSNVVGGGALMVVFKL
jgi:hypothetical protein